MIYINKQSFILIAVYIFIFATIQIHGRCIIPSDGDNEGYCEIAKGEYRCNVLEIWFPRYCFSLDSLESVANRSNIFKNDFKTTTISHQPSRNIGNTTSNNKTRRAAINVLPHKIPNFTLEYLKEVNLLHKIVQPKNVTEQMKHVVAGKS